MISTTGSIVVPLSDGITTANVQDNQIYDVLTSSSLPSTTMKKTYCMISDPGYDDQYLYDKYEIGLSTCMSCVQIQNYIRRKTSTG